MVAGDLKEVAQGLQEQPEALERYARADIPRASRGSIFVGAGDSYAAALVGFFASEGRCLAVEPYALACAPRMALGADVYFISVSGRTTSNILASRAARPFAKKMAALTAVEDSPLGREVGEVLPLPMDYAPKVPGMLSFSLSALAILKLVGVGGPIDFEGTRESAKKEVHRLALGRDTTYFLGNSLCYPAALYASAKVYEILGKKAHAEQIEEFSHLELFSLTRSDAVNIFSEFDPEMKAAKLGKNLARARFQSRVVPPGGDSMMERFFRSVFVAQLFPLSQGSKIGLARPKFLAKGPRLAVSDEMIY